MGLSTRRLMLGAALFLFIPCFGQQVVDKFDNNRALIGDVLKDANASGSLAYSGTCKSHEGRFAIPPRVLAPIYPGSTVEILQRMFADNPKMRVNQEPNGMIRMAETDVPTDILDVRISHISFADSDDPEPYQFHGTLAALSTILASPEVRAFKREHNIEDRPTRLEGVMPGPPDVRGELNNVTVSQALDYVLKASPGYWIYENCAFEDGTRTIHFGFSSNR